MQKETVSETKKEFSHHQLTFHCCCRVVKATSPYLNILIILGVIIIYGDVVLFGIDGRVTSSTLLKITCNVCMCMHIHGNVIIVIAFNCCHAMVVGKV